MENLHDSDSLIRENIISYIKMPVLSKKEEQELKKLVIENEDIAKDIYRTINHINKELILVYLILGGRGEDIAKESARERAYKWGVMNCTEQEEKEFKSWLAGEHDNMPEVMPTNRYIRCLNYHQSVELCYLSKVSTFTERLCAYGMKIGYIDIVKDPVKEMMNCISVDYARSFLENTISKYNISNEDVMQMYSSIYSIRKTKLEAEFYLSYIQEWLKNDRIEYMKAVNNISGDMRRKILKKLKTI